TGGLQPRHHALELLWIAGEQLGVGQDLLAPGDSSVELLYPDGQKVVVALVLVAELARPRCRRRWRCSGWLVGLLRRRALVRPLLPPGLPVGIAARDDINIPAAFEPQRDRDRSVEEIAVMAD